MFRFNNHNTIPQVNDAYSYSSYSKKPPLEDVVLDWNVAVIQPTKQMLGSVVAYIPDLIAAVYTLVFGWIFAKIAMIIVKKFLTAIQFDKIADKVGIKAMFDDAGISVTATQWLSNLMFWIIIFIAGVLCLDKLRLDTASYHLNFFFSYSISITLAFVIFILGLFLSTILSKIVLTTAKALKLSKPNVYAGIMRYGIIGFTTMLALSQFAIPGEAILIIIGVTFITLCLTFIVAFGIGGRQWAGKILDKIA